MEAENYQLKWHSFTSYLHACVATSLHNEAFADVALVTVDGHQLMAHRFILSASSQFFNSILKLQVKLSTSLPIIIVLPPEISFRTLKILIQYMYSGEATVSKDILEYVLRGGDILKIKGLWRPKNYEKHEKRSRYDSSTSNSPSVSPRVQEKVGSKVVPQQQSVIQTNPSPSPSPPKKACKLASQKVLNYTINVKKMDKLVEEDKSKDYDEKASSSSCKRRESETKVIKKCEEGSNSMQYLVIKEEPMEWPEDTNMELVDEKDVFETEMSIKPEIFMEESNDKAEDLYSPLTCELCTETFTIPAEWVRHVQTHTDMLPAKRQRRDKPYENNENETFPALHCDMCQKDFPTPAEWVQHIQNTHTEFELRVANQKAPTGSSSKEFKQSRTPSNDLNKICADCNKSFPSHASMIIHKRTHTGERPYQCEFCFKGFNVKSNLLRHLRTLHDKIINPTEVDGKDDENVVE